METYYVDTLGKINKDTTISLYSDFHLKTNDQSNRYNVVLNNLKKVNQDYILILGDFIEDTNISSEEIDKVYKYLCMITSIAPLFYIFGNHELRTEVDGKEVGSINNNYFDMLKLVPNLHVLENESVLLDENIGLTGINLPFDYYVNDNEDKEVYLNYIVSFIKNNLLGNLDSNSYNILLQHTPNNIVEKETYLRILEIIKELLNKDFNFDLAIFGHLHNGLIPRYIDKYLPGNRGLIGISGITRNILQNDCRGMKHITDDTTGIILPAVSTFPHNPIINSFFPPSGKTLILKK